MLPDALEEEARGGEVKFVYVDRGLEATDVAEWDQAASGSLGEITEAYMRG